MPARIAVARAAQEISSYRRRAFFQNVAVLAAGAASLVAIGFYLPKSSGEPWRTIVDLVLVAGFSALVAYGELLSRYRDRAGELIAAPPTPMYLLVNVAAGIAALLIVHGTGVVAATKAPRLYEILLAGFGAVTFFRTSLFTMRVGGTDIGVGPSALLQSLLAAADRMIDRDQAQARANDVAGIMRKISFDKARAALPSLCFTLVENLTPAEQKAAGDQIRGLANSTEISKEAKAIILGVYLIRQVGADVLALAVRALGAEIEKEPSPDPCSTPAQ